MNITGIIAEYNPFHNGHQYQIQQAREHGADYVIAAISGDFVQRGAPAILDKYARARMALLGGADLVLELPAVYATASAEAFARGGVMALHATGIVDALCYGVEAEDPAALESLARILQKEPDWYRQQLQLGLRAGLSYPAARSHALPEYAALLSCPNNILALEYAKAADQLAPQLALLPIRRQGAGHHDTAPSGGFASASAIRAWLHQADDALRHVQGPDASLWNAQGLGASPWHVQNPDASLWNAQGSGSSLWNALPRDVRALIEECRKESAFLWEDDLSLPLHLRLMEQTHASLLGYSDISPALASRILNMRVDFSTFTDFCHLLKTRNLTYARIRRALLHLLLGITDGLMEMAQRMPYLRVLGLRRSASRLLSEMREQSLVPVIISLPKAVSGSGLTQEARELLQCDMDASSLYRALLTARTSRPCPSEFRRKLLIVEA